VSNPVEGKILVVDDEESVRRVIALGLQRSGLVVLEAANGPEAIGMTMAHGATLDLVVLDMTMPGMNGAQVFETLHQLQPDLPFLIYCGGGDTDALQQLLQSGVCEFLCKPASLKILFEKVKAMRSRHPRRPRA